MLFQVSDANAFVLRSCMFVIEEVDFNLFDIPDVLLGKADFLKLDYKEIVRSGSWSYWPRQSLKDLLAERYYGDTVLGLVNLFVDGVRETGSHTALVTPKIFEKMLPYKECFLREVSSQIYGRKICDMEYELLDNGIAVNVSVNYPYFAETKYASSEFKDFLKAEQEMIERLEAEHNAECDRLYALGLLVGEDQEPINKEPFTPPLIDYDSIPF